MSADDFMQLVVSWLRAVGLFAALVAVVVLLFWRTP